MIFFQTMNTREISAAECAFLFLVFFLALFFVALGGGMIFFQIVNALFPEVYSGISQGTLKTGFSFVLVASPLVFFFGRKLHLALLEKKIPLESAVRRWLEYAALFFAAATFMGDIAATLTAFLNGELTTRFLLKSLILFVIAGGIFWFFLWDLREENLEHRKKKAPILFSGFLVFALLAITAGLTFLESPTTARNRRIDNETESNLTSVKYAVQDFYQTRDKLPLDLSELEKDPTFSGRFDAENLEYTKKNDREYELCANFLNDNSSDDDYREWVHLIGKSCFPIMVEVGTK